MKKYLLLAILISTQAVALHGQTISAPPGSSIFIRELAGLLESDGKPDLLSRIARDRIDVVEAGGGVEEWTAIDGRVFLTRRWMVEIGKVNEGYSTWDLEKALAEEFRKQLSSEGFSISPPTSQLYSTRYLKDKTVGTLEVRSFFLGNGNLPFRMEFIFNESYLISDKKR